MEAALSPTVVDLEKQYLLQNYARYPVVLHRGKGCYVYDTAGKRYLDLLAGIGAEALGHTPPPTTQGKPAPTRPPMPSSHLLSHAYTPPPAGTNSNARQVP